MTLILAAFAQTAQTYPDIGTIGVPGILVYLVAVRWLDGKKKNGSSSAGEQSVEFWERRFDAQQKVLEELLAESKEQTKALIEILTITRMSRGQGAGSPR